MELNYWFDYSQLPIQCDIDPKLNIFPNIHLKTIFATFGRILHGLWKFMNLLKLYEEF